MLLFWFLWYQRLFALLNVYMSIRDRAQNEWLIFQVPKENLMLKLFLARLKQMTIIILFNLHLLCWISALTFRLKTIIMFIRSLNFCTIWRTLRSSFTFCDQNVWLMFTKFFTLPNKLSMLLKSSCRARTLHFTTHDSPFIVDLMSCHFSILYLVPLYTKDLMMWVPSAGKYRGNVSSLSRVGVHQEITTNCRRNKEKNWVDAS